MTRKLRLAVLGLISLGFANASRGQEISLAVPAATEHWVLPESMIPASYEQFGDRGMSDSTGPSSYSINEFPAEPLDTYLAPAKEFHRPPTHVELGIDYLSFERSESLPFGDQTGFQISAVGRDRTDGEYKAMEYVFRYLAGEDGGFGEVDGYSASASTESSLFDFQANAISGSLDDRWSFAGHIGLRSMLIKDKFTFTTSQPARSAKLKAENFLFGPQIGLRNRFSLGPTYIGAAGNIGLMCNWTESKIWASNSATTSFWTFAPFADVDVHAGVQLGNSTELEVGAYFLAMQGVSTADDPMAIARSDGSDFGVTGIRFSLSHRF